MEISGPEKPDSYLEVINMNTKCINTQAREQKFLTCTTLTKPLSWRREMENCFHPSFLIWISLSTEYKLLMKGSFRLPCILLWIKVSWLLSPAPARIIICKLIKHIWASTRAITDGDGCCQVGRCLHVLFAQHLSPLDHRTSVCTFPFYYDNTAVQQLSFLKAWWKYVMIFWNMRRSCLSLERCFLWCWCKNAWNAPKLN